jgi:hypothetical protein
LSTTPLGPGSAQSTNSDRWVDTRTAVRRTASQYAGYSRPTRDATKDGTERPHALMSTTNPLIMKNR